MTEAVNIPPVDPQKGAGRPVLRIKRCFGDEQHVNLRQQKIHAACGYRWKIQPLWQDKWIRFTSPQGDGTFISRRSLTEVKLKSFSKINRDFDDLLNKM